MRKTAAAHSVGRARRRGSASHSNQDAFVVGDAGIAKLKGEKISLNEIVYLLQSSSYDVTIRSIHIFYDHCI